MRPKLLVLAQTMQIIVTNACPTEAGACTQCWLAGCCWHEVRSMFCSSSCLRQSLNSSCTHQITLQGCKHSWGDKLLRRLTIHLSLLPSPHCCHCLSHRCRWPAAVFAASLALVDKGGYHPLFNPHISRTTPFPANGVKGIG